MHIFSHLSLTGGSWQCLAGFPLCTFYFPLPGLISLGPSHLLSHDMAFKVLTVLETLLFPFAAGAHARVAKLSGTLGLATVLVAAAHLLGTTHTGNGATSPQRWQANTTSHSRYYSAPSIWRARSRALIDSVTRPSTCSCWRLRSSVTPYPHFCRHRVCCLGSQ